MIVLIIYFVLTFLAVAFVIYCGAKWPDSPTLKSTKEWQTMIGSFIGFAGVSLAIYFQGYIERHNASQIKKAMESSIIQTSINHIDLQKSEILLMSINIGTINQLHKIENINRCEEIEKEIEKFKFYPIPLENRASELIEKISSELYLDLSYLFIINPALMAKFDKFNKIDCINDVEKSISYINKSIDRADEELDFVAEMLITLGNDKGYNTVQSDMNAAN